MTVLDFILLLLVAGLCGAIGQSIVGYSRGGCLASIGVGFIGSLIGWWIARAMHLPEIFMLNFGGTQFPVVWAIFGGAIFVAVLSLISGRGAPRGRR